MTALQIVKDNLSSCLMFSFLQDKYSYFLSYVMRHNIQAPHRPGSSPRDQIWLIFLVSTVQVRFDQQSRGETTSIFLLVIQYSINAPQSTVLLTAMAYCLLILSIKRITFQVFFILSHITLSYPFILVQGAWT